MILKDKQTNMERVNQFNCFEEEHANSVDMPKTTSNPLRKKKKQLRKFESKYKSNPTPELSCSIDKLKEEIDKMQNPEKYKYTREPKFKKRKFDKSDKHVKKRIRQHNIKKNKTYNKANRKRERMEMERKAKEHALKEQWKRWEEERRRSLEEERQRREQERQRWEQEQRQRWEQERQRREKEEEERRLESILMDCPSDIKSFARTKDPVVRKRKYRKLSLKYHPDKGGDDKWMKIINNINDRVQVVIH